MKVKAVIGLLFGDEGKGVTVQNLVREAQSKGESVAVVRFSGGPQAAHTVIHQGKKHVCSTYGAGVLLGAPTYLTGDVYFDPSCANKERMALEKIGITDPELHVCRHVKRITPYDILMDRLDSQVKQHGTCGKGIHATFVRCNEGIPHSVAGKFYKTRHGLVSDDADKLYRQQIADEKDLMSHNMTWEDEGDLRENLKQYDTVIFEGSQGLLLDMDRGFFPHVTPSRTGLDNIADCVDITGAEIYLVCRSYLTRHGNGWEPIGSAPKNHCLKQQLEDVEINITNEYQGEFKTGAFDIPLAQTAWDRHCIDNWIAKHRLIVNLVITHADAFPANGGTDRSVHVILSKDPRFGSECPLVHSNHLFNALQLFMKLPFRDKICRVYENSSPEGNMKELNQDDYPLY